VKSLVRLLGRRAVHRTISEGDPSHIKSFRKRRPSEGEDFGGGHGETCGPGVATTPTWPEKESDVICEKKDGHRRQGRLYLNRRGVLGA